MSRISPKASDREQLSHARTWAIRGGIPALALLAFLWFPFDWLATVWPAFGVPFRQVFRNAHDHFVGHGVFFFLVGFFVLLMIPALRGRPQWYIPGLVAAALIQETVQAFFRGELPSFTDFNAFKGDALGGISAFVLWLVIGVVGRRSEGNKPGSPTNLTPLPSPMRRGGTRPYRFFRLDRFPSLGTGEGALMRREQEPDESARR